VPELILPTVDIHTSYLAAMREYVAEGRGEPSDTSNIGRDIRLFADKWATRPGFQTFVDALRAQEREETFRPANFVPTTTLWWVEGTDFLGRLSIRHRLAPGRIGNRNGHIGYDVRPSARRQGHATAMLAAAKPRAAALGITEALITCDATNTASRRTIEQNGGRPTTPLDERLRYWLPTT